MPPHFRPIASVHHWLPVALGLTAAAPVYALYRQPERLHALYPNCEHE